MDINKSLNLICKNSRSYKKTADILLELYSELNLIIEDDNNLKQNHIESFDLLLMFMTLLFFNPENIPLLKSNKIKHWEEIYNRYSHPGQIFLELMQTSISPNLLSLPKDSCQVYSDNFHTAELNKIQWGTIANNLTQKFHWEPCFLNATPNRKNVITLDIFDFVTTQILENEAAYNKKLGVVYTPNSLASLITENTFLYWINTTFADLNHFKSLHNFLKVIKKKKDNIRSVYVKKLKEIKILDPASGTGVFLLTAANILLNILIELCEKTPIQEIKLNIIQDNLFGIDIDPHAVKVSKIKIWLWLTEINQKKPFDSIDFSCNIFEGNSLFGYQTLPQDYENLILNKRNGEKGKISIDNLYENEIFLKFPIYTILTSNTMARLIKHLSKIHKTYLENPYFRYFIIEGERAQWNSLKDRLDQKLKKRTKYSISTEKEIESKLYAVFSKPLDKLDTELDIELFSNSVKYRIPKKFHWDTAGFSKFDLIIGNPPYIALTDLSLISRQQLRAIYPNIYSGNNDLVYFFIYRALNALQENNGFLTFLLPKYLLHSLYARKIRDFITKSAKILEIQDISELSVFYTKNIKNIILYLKKSKTFSDHIINYKIFQKKSDIVVLNTRHIFQSSLTSEKWILLDSWTSDLLNKMKKVSNKVLSDIVEISKGIETGCDQIFAPKQPYYFSRKLCIKNDHVRNWVKGKNVKRFFIQRTGREVLYAPFYRKLDIESNKKVMKYLESKKSILLKRSRVSEYYLWRLGDERKTMRWALPKIVTPYRSRRNRFAIDWHGSLSSKDVVWIIPKDTERDEDVLLFLMGLLNSDVLSFFAKNSIKDLGGLYEYYPKQIENFPLVIPKRNSPEFKTICELSSLLMEEKKGKNRYEFEKELNDIVFKLYNLSEADINSIKKSLISGISFSSGRNMQYSTFSQIK
ncbi:MAG: Eco57I restriction-modification methylase domain-containing protein [Candidatus Hermodarchaeota archaeon]